MSMAYVVIQTESAPSLKVMLKNPMVLGRAIGSDLWIDDAQISRQHCRFDEEDDDWIVTDLGSSHGTFVNGNQIEKHRLDENDMLVVGKARLIFHEGDFVEYRPADPMEATSMGTGSAKWKAPGEGKKLTGHKLPEARFVTAGSSAGQESNKSVSLPFTRPPAKPIVNDGAGPISKLLRVIFSWKRTR